MKLIISQCVCVAFSIYISRTEKLKHVYVATFLQSMANVILYLLNQDLATAMACGIVAFRGLVYIFKDRLKNIWVIPFIFLIVHVVTGFSALVSPWQIITIISPCATCLYMWFGKTTQQIRAGNASVYTAWFIYDIHSKLYIVALTDAIMACTNIIAFIQHRKKT